MSTLKSARRFQQRLTELGLDLPFDEVIESGATALLATPIPERDPGVSPKIGNRFCILPMEGWDGELDGRPTELTRRRWRNFGRSGAKLIWGGEAVAVRMDGRANPHQLVINDHTLGSIQALRELLVAAHAEQFESTSDLLVGLQLTHSGRFARPHEKTRAEPRIVYRHPALDDRVGIRNDTTLLTDDDLRRLVDDFVLAARRADQAGFAFVDVKHCHGYLGHELLSGYDRPGAYGGPLENRTRFLREIVTGIRAEAPRLEVAIRLSIFDFVPFFAGNDGIGRPALDGPYRFAFGGDGTGTGIDLAEVVSFVGLVRALGIRMACTTAGSPYYNPHIQRPAIFPPSDGYLPPEDPLVGVERQIRATAELKKMHPEAILVGSGYSYLQEWLPHVGQAAVRTGMVDSVGLGRMVLSYPELPADVLSHGKMQRKKICRTFSDCTTAPRNGLVSGCYPLDPFYKARAEFTVLAKLKRSKE